MLVCYLGITITYGDQSRLRLLLAQKPGYPLLKSRSSNSLSRDTTLIRFLFFFLLTRGIASGVVETNSTNPSSCEADNRIASSALAFAKSSPLPSFRIVLFFSLWRFSLSFRAAFSASSLRFFFVAFAPPCPDPPLPHHRTTRPCVFFSLYSCVHRRLKALALAGRESPCWPSRIERRQGRGWGHGRTLSTERAGQSRVLIRPEGIIEAWKGRTRCPGRA